VDETAEKKASFHAEALPYMDAVYGFALRLAGSPDAAEDLVQETFLRAYRAWDQYTVGTRCRSWLFTICRNVFLRQRERGRRHDEILREELASGWSADGVESGAVNPLWQATRDVDPEGEFFGSIVDDEILEAIDELPEEYRTAVVLSDLEGMPYSEIAEIMNVPVGTVKSRLFRGRRRLQERLYAYAVEMGYVPPRADADEKRPPGRGAADLP
jgi:RNA polymerase sigma-70 factor (ECF subfamily)